MTQVGHTRKANLKWGICARSGRQNPCTLCTCNVVPKTVVPGRTVRCFKSLTPAVVVALAKVSAIATVEARGAEVAVVVLVAVAKVLSIATVVAGVSVV
jgi:hypothetical protein